MQTSPAPPVIRPPSSRRWLWMGLALVLIPLLTLGGLALGVASYFRLSSDTRALRSELMRASGAEWRQRIGLNVGSTTLGLVRAGLSCTQIKPEALAAFRAVRSFEVGIYELASRVDDPNRTALLAAADGVMNARGWERVVGVLDGRQMVGVYLPAELGSPRRVKACVVVLDDRQMVVVSAQGNLEPLVECLRQHHDWQAKVRSLASR